MTQLERRGYSLKALFLVVTLGAVFASLLHSGIERHRAAGWKFQPLTNVAVAVLAASLVVGSVVGGLVGAGRPPRVRNVFLGIVLGSFSGGLAAMLVILPPRWQAILPACLVLLITGGIARWTAK